jgi:hypothetical protein
VRKDGEDLMTGEQLSFPFHRPLEDLAEVECPACHLIVPALLLCEKCRHELWRLFPVLSGEPITRGDEP